MSRAGDLLAKHRNDRALTQDALATAAGVSLSTIQALEYGRVARWRSDTSLRVFKILMEIALFEQDEAYQFLDALGLGRGLFHTVTEEVEAGRAPRSTSGTPMVAINPARARAELYVIADQLLATVGEDEAAAIMRGALATATARKSAERALNIRHPPRQYSTDPPAIEESTTTYEKVDEPKPAADGKPRARKIR